MSSSQEVTRYKTWQDAVNCFSLAASGLMKQSMKEKKLESAAGKLLDIPVVKYEMDYDITTLGKLYAYISNDMEDSFKLNDSGPLHREEGWRKSGEYFFKDK
ncbi:MAG: hypothetical protein F6K16_30170 [Symploca sp. SIO2B6]|nr:hypothetical protein [Symploca sp. SIO2B6]